MKPDRTTGRAPHEKDAADVHQVVQSQHGGDPCGALLEALDRINVSSTERIAATGRKFRLSIRLPTLPEPEAVEQAYARIKP